MTDCVPLFMYSPSVLFFFMLCTEVTFKNNSQIIPSVTGQLILKGLFYCFFCFFNIFS